MSFAGTARTEVAVGTVSEPSILATTRPATPRSGSRVASLGVAKTGAGLMTACAGVGCAEGVAAATGAGVAAGAAGATTGAGAATGAAGATTGGGVATGAALCTGAAGAVAEF